MLILTTKEALLNAPRETIDRVLNSCPWCNIVATYILRSNNGMGMVHSDSMGIMTGVMTMNGTRTYPDFHARVSDFIQAVERKRPHHVTWMITDIIEPVHRI